MLVLKHEQLRTTHDGNEIAVDNYSQGFVAPLSKWQWTVERLLKFRKAGLDIPDEPPVSD